VVTHEGVAALPIDLTMYTLARCWGCTFEFVDYQRSLLTYLDHLG
jgi:hypothetical protein